MEAFNTRARGPFLDFYTENGRVVFLCHRNWQETLLCRIYLSGKLDHLSTSSLNPSNPIPLRVALYSIFFAQNSLV